ncbi:hypothetical protein MTR67_042931 [Solanum verrucosum]|uniref:Uncharacterized protein n=1 Tax=Solanum verrucosum TaxID=315347 RepID=A0AAF0ZS81_SOLVR|nr:hypothetical protein MTR67_042931 [Solanum verrucosum]
MSKLLLIFCKFPCAFTPASDLSHVFFLSHYWCISHHFIHFGLRAEGSLSCLQTKALISKLTEEKISVVQQNNKLQQELELLRRERNRSRGGIPTVYVLVIALVGILLGYLLKRI